MHLNVPSRPFLGALLLTGLMAAGSASAVTSHVIDVSGIESMGELGDPGNTSFSVQVGGLSAIVGVGWNVTLQADAPSWLSEIGVTLGTSAQPFELLVEPGAADPFLSGTQSYSSPVIDLVAQNLQFSVGPDGWLRLEFTEGFDDFASATDGRWVSGTLTIDVSPIPEPATYGLMGLGLLGVAAAARRRRG